MRKVKLFIANSLDNYIARPDGAVDWLFTDGDYGMSDFFQSVDAALLGRKTYDVALTLGKGGEAAFRGMKYYVFSRTPSKSKNKNVQFVSDNIGKFVEQLKQAKGKDIWLMGGGELTASFLNENLLDELVLTVHPVLLGSGIPLFPGQHRQIDLRLVQSRSYESGIVQLHYCLK